MRGSGQPRSPPRALQSLPLPLSVPEADPRAPPQHRRAPGLAPMGRAGSPRPARSSSPQPHGPARGRPVAALPLPEVEAGPAEAKTAHEQQQEGREEPGRALHAGRQSLPQEPSPGADLRAAGGALPWAGPAGCPRGAAEGSPWRWARWWRGVEGWRRAFN